MRADCGLTGVGVHCDDELLVLAHTPGIPREWIYAALGFQRHHRRRLADMINGANSAELNDRGRENAMTVEAGDGWKMLQAVVPDYAGAAPFWSQVELQLMARSNAVIGEILGVNQQRVRRWRTNIVFEPLSGLRLINNRGRKSI